MTKLQEVKEAVIKANPEIVELKFGCHVMIKADEYDSLYCTIVERDSNSNVKLQVPERSDYMWIANHLIDEILGRPIRLADALLAVMKTTRWLGQRVEDQAKDFFNLVMHWDKEKDSLDEQDEPTISFLHGLLVKENEK